MDWMEIAGLLISGGVIAKVIDVAVNRRRNAAETEGTIAAMTLSVMKQTIDNTVTPLNVRIDDLEDDLEAQAKTIEELNTKFVRVQLVVVILSEQVKQLGQRPVIDIETMDKLTTDELRDIAMGIRNQRIKYETAIAKKEDKSRQQQSATPPGAE